MRNTAAAIRSIILTATFYALMTLCIAGCGDIGKNPLWQQVDSKQEETNRLQLQVQQLQQENEDYRKRLETLSKMDKETRLEAINTLDRIEIAKRSGLTDENSDGKKDTLIIYLKPFDTHGDPIKFTGKVRVELWDLNSAADKAMLYGWDIAPEQLAKMWSSTFLTSYYRLRFEVADKIAGRDKELTVKVEFTDFVSGRVLREQAIVQP